jgi:hypothetical protein
MQPARTAPGVPFVISHCAEARTHAPAIIVARPSVTSFRKPSISSRGFRRVIWRPLFHNVQEENLFVRRHLSDVGLIVATGIECPIESLCPVSQFIAMGRIRRRHRRHCFCEITQDVRKQPIVEVRANSFAYVGCTGPVQAERNSGFVEMSIEACRSLECSLSGYSSATSALSGMGLVMARLPPMWAMID